LQLDLFPIRSIVDIDPLCSVPRVQLACLPGRYYTPTCAFPPCLESLYLGLASSNDVVNIDS
jgi:hypothetical protein